MPLSPRLKTLLDRCVSGVPLWDLCCDHGLLGLDALKSGRFSEVIFNDAVAHVLEPLRSRVGGEARMICALAEDIAEPLSGNVVLAGVGGERIFRILSTHAARGTLRARKIVACPEKDAEWFAAQMIPAYELREDLVIPHGRGSRRVFVYECSEA